MLAISAIGAAAARSPLPELLIAAGATVHAAALGSMHWLLWTFLEDQATAFAVVDITVPLGDAAALVLAAGFASGALSWPAGD